VYLLAMILGLPARVTAMFGQVTGRELEDNAAVILGYADGALAIAETSSVTRISPFSIEVHGTEGSIVYTEPGIGALVAERDGAPTPPVGEPHLRLWSASSAESAEHGWLDLDIEPDAPAAIEQWYAHATTGMRGRANLDLALALSSVIEAAYTSARTASTVTVAPCD
jgi:predicted dehydrogenase